MKTTYENLNCNVPNISCIVLFHLNKHMPIQCLIGIINLVSVYTCIHTRLQVYLMAHTI